MQQGRDRQIYAENLTRLEKAYKELLTLADKRAAELLSLLDFMQSSDRGRITPTPFNYRICSQVILFHFREHLAMPKGSRGSRS